ncbi:MAG: sigma-54-dependent Fis family transcriptional regulator [Deltaproteobacteria bacterium]|nr:sigma-54-dependent Fis family transcriptional regulator [Deltaproteobacteria bacterium]
MSARILVVDDEAGLRKMLEILFQRAGYEVDTMPSVTPALLRIETEPPYDLVVTDLLMPDGSGMQVLEKARDKDESTQVVMVTAYATTEQAVEAMRKGAYDYVQKPFRNDALKATVEKALEKRALLDENRALRDERRHALRDLVGRSPALRQVADLVGRLADAPTSVLITGESGTGKEVVARSLHTAGCRATKPFVALNCGALPEALMESELFGHEKGAFTGAATAKEGLFRAAAGGTIFLDEIGEMPASVQVKLLRVLQERRVRPVGGETEIEVDVRVVAATNRDLEAGIQDGTFRQDLFYRLNVVHIAVPPLRERAEDIPHLAEHFLWKYGSLMHKRLQFSPEALRWISNQPYPGNVRELENVIERAVTLAATDKITLEDLPPGASDGEPRLAPSVVLPDEGLDLGAYLAEVERNLLMAALERSGGVRTAAAKLLGMSFRSFRYRLAKHDFDEADEEGDSSR